MPSSILPREGLTLEAAFAPLRLTFLQPLLTGPVLLAASQAPALVARWPSLEAFQELRSTRVLTGLSVLFGIGLLRKLNNIMSRLVLNNFTTDRSWDWSKEVVVVTGGSGGIGYLMVKMFAERNITVVILDIAPPKTPIACENQLHFLKLSLTVLTST